MTSKSESLLTIRGLDASKAYSTIQDGLGAINDAIEAGNQDDRDLLTMCAAWFVIWRQLYALSENGDRTKDSDSKDRSPGYLRRQAESMIDEISAIPSRTINGHQGKAVVYLAWHFQNLAQEAEPLSNRLALALAIDLLGFQAPPSLGPYRETLFARLTAVSGRPELLGEMIDDQVRQAAKDRSTTSTPPTARRIPAFLIGWAFPFKMFTHSFWANKSLDGLEDAGKIGQGDRRPNGIWSKEKRLPNKVFTPKEGAIIAGIVAAVALRLAESSSNCRPEIRSISASTTQKSRLDQAADLIIRSGLSVSNVFCVLSNEELIDIVGCDRRRTAFQQIESVLAIIEFNAFDLAVHVFRRSGKHWSLETLSEPDELLELPGLDMSIPLGEIYRFVGNKENNSAEF